MLLFNDTNGDAVRQEVEEAIPEGAVSITNRAGSVSLTEDTQEGMEPICVDDILEGDYNITVAIPEGYNPTTVLNYALTLEAGEEAYLDFGAQVSSETVEEQPVVEEESDRSFLLGIVGGLLLLAGVGLAIFASRMGRQSSGIPPSPGSQKKGQ